MGGFQQVRGGGQVAGLSPQGEVGLTDWGGACGSSLGFLVHGQFKGEPAALADFASDADSAAVRLDDVLDEGEADADPLGFATEFGAAAIKPFEDPFVFGGRDAFALVLDPEPDESRLLVCVGNGGRSKAHV